MSRVQFLQHFHAHGLGRLSSCRVRSATWSSARPGGDGGDAVSCRAHRERRGRRLPARAAWRTRSRATPWDRGAGADRAGSLTRLPRLSAASCGVRYAPALAVARRCAGWRWRARFVALRAGVVDQPLLVEPGSAAGGSCGGRPALPPGPAAAHSRRRARRSRRSCSASSTGCGRLRPQRRIHACSATASARRASMSAPIARWRASNACRPTARRRPPARVRRRLSRPPLARGRAALGRTRGRRVARRRLKRSWRNRVQPAP